MPLILRFDKGTLLLSGTDIVRKLSQEILQLFVWDDRVGCLRSCASNYRQVIGLGKSQQIQIVDNVFNTVEPPIFSKQIALRPYQEVALLNWEIAGQKGIVCLPTGAGKTRVALAVLAEKRVNALCIVPTRVLLEQWHSALREYYDGPIGVIGDNKNSVESLTLATFESAYRKMSLLGNRFQLLIVDECHHFGAKYRDEIFLMAAAPMRLGLTATKPKDPEQIVLLEKYIGPVVHEVGINELVGKYLAPFDLVHLLVCLSPVEKVRYQREYAIFTSYFKFYKSRNPHSKWRDFIFFAQKSAQGKNALSAFFRTKRMISLTEGKRAVVKKILDRHKNEKVIIFTTDTEAAYQLSRDFLIMPITADIKRKEREWALSKFKSGELRVLVSCKVLNEGVDVPDAAVAVIVGGTAIEREYVQRIGRILRPSPNKRALIYELVAKDTHEERHSVQRRIGLNTDVKHCEKKLTPYSSHERYQ